MRLRVLLACLAVPVLLWAVLPMVSSGAPSPGRLDALDRRIDRAQDEIDRKRRLEQGLSQDISRYSARIGDLQGEITELQRRQNELQADLDAARAELAETQDALRVERARLVRLRSRLRHARRVLSQRLIEVYKADDPDVLTVVLEADGFADLLERGEFISRVNDQDTSIITRVRRAKVDAKRSADRLARLERRQQDLAARILGRRDQVAQVKGRLATRRDEYVGVRAGRRRALGNVRTSRVALEGDLRAMEREQGRIQAQLARAAQAQSSGGGGGSTLPAGPIRGGSGGLIWPVNGPVVSPFGPRWGRLHAGIDIAVPTGTPIRAPADGEVVLLGVVGGYGNYTCIQHGGGLSTCHAHQSRFATSQGASVRRGQVIGYVGCTGHCFGDHLHFETRVNGVPRDPMGYL